ncbi:hypothetical protein [Mangrovihabitans endophyticus]|uniref:DUF1616 domain-containing protein n=1 Tax=Mangrovihabitans endophyticus TaxID=1751298 RepID=A0A8J3C060_9ACTN|nr:hypothetical protein [Mangrovihabitans endophyticus]GGK91543.1 hypothetical protein GCM10012284_26770 [Mangrovihabitans endophyticus]
MSRPMNWLAARLLAVVTVLAAVAVLAAPQPLAVAGALLLGFALPGLALTEVLFRRQTMTAVERTVLAPALSLGVLVISGLVGNAAGMPLDRAWWAVSAAAVTLAALIVWTAVVRPVRLRRRPAAGTAEAETVQIPVVREAPSPQEAQRRADQQAELARRRLAEKQLALAQQRVRQAQAREQRRRVVREFLPLLLVLAVLGGAGWVSLRSAHESYHVTVTTLSAAPPGAPNGDGNRTLRLTADGLLAADGPYTLVVTGADGARVDRRTVPAGDGSWTGSLVVPADQRLTVTLYRSGDTTAYRTLFVAAS